MDELTLFKDVHKGNVTQADKGIRWELGEIVLIFYLDKVEDYCSVLLKGKKRERELTHLHLSREETIDLIKLVDDPSKKIAVVFIVNRFVFLYTPPYISQKRPKIYHLRVRKI